jgi:hypothetical protein
LFPVVRGGSTVRVCGEFVELGCPLVRVIWHTVSHPRGTISSHFPNCPILYTYATRNFMTFPRQSQGSLSILLPGFPKQFHGSGRVPRV